MLSVFPAAPEFYCVGMGAIFLVALGKGAFGGGLAILGIPLLALVVDPVQAAIIVAMLVAFMDLFALKAFGRANMSWPDLKLLLPGLALGLFIGWTVFTFVDQRIVTLVIGLITIAFTAHWFLRGRMAIQGHMPPHAGLALAAGLASGFTTFVAHAGGPPVAMYLLRRGLEKSAFAGTTVAFFTFGNLLKLPPYLQLGLKQPHALWAALALAPVVPAGVWIGKALHDRIEQKALFFWCYCLLAVAAVKLVVDAVLSLVR